MSNASLGPALCGSAQHRRVVMGGATAALSVPARIVPLPVREQQLHERQ